MITVKYRTIYMHRKHLHLFIYAAFMSGCTNFTAVREMNQIKNEYVECLKREIQTPAASCENLRLAFEASRRAVQDSR